MGQQGHSSPEAVEAQEEQEEALQYQEKKDRGEQSEQKGNAVGSGQVHFGGAAGRVSDEKVSGRLLEHHSGRATTCHQILSDIETVIATGLCINCMHAPGGLVDMV